MNRAIDESVEVQLRRLAAAIPYPPTPDLTVAVAEAIAGHHRRPLRRPLQPVWIALLALLILLAGLLSIAPVRATILDWLQIGGVRIWQRMPPTATPPSALPPAAVPLPHKATTAQPTAGPTATALLSVLDFTGETSLTAAQSAVDFSIRLPTYPTDLGEPDHVYLQRAEGDTVILVWMETARPAQVHMSLHLLGPGAFVWKMQPPTLAETTVNGEWAIWTEGPYYIQAGGGWGNRRLVDGHVLIWTAGEMTYRLESVLALEEAVRVAESLVVVE